MNRRARVRGFTLLELLIAIVLASLLAVLTYSGLQLGLRSWEVSDRRQQALESHYLTQTLLRRVLESPLQVVLRDEEGVLQMGYWGQPDGVIFIARIPQIDSSQQRYWVQLTQPEVADGQAQSTWQLVLRYLPFDSFESLDWPLLSERISMLGQQEIVIDELAEPLQFEYLEQLTGREPVWQTEWQQHEQLPALLRISSRQESDLHLTVGPRELAYGIKTVE